MAPESSAPAATSPIVNAKDAERECFYDTSTIAPQHKRRA